jgi:hypothetical protein
MFKVKFTKVYVGGFLDGRKADAIETFASRDEADFRARELRSAEYDFRAVRGAGTQRFMPVGAKVEG